MSNIMLFMNNYFYSKFWLEAISGLHLSDRSKYESIQIHVKFQVFT